jgi:hypothetical protein
MLTDVACNTAHRSAKARLDKPFKLALGQYHSVHR